MMTIPTEDTGPVVVIREGPGPQSRNREWEWYAALNMISIGISILLTPRTLELGAFRYVLFMGVSASWVWLLFIVLGSLRVCVLFLNGMIPYYGPHIRAASCVVGAIIWSTLTLALIRLTEDTGTLSIGIGAWSWATVFELRALHRALIDVGSR